MTTRVIPTTCKECSVRCGALVHVEDGRVVRITGNPGHPGSRGAFCVKGMNAPIVAREHADRPLYPLRRAGERGDGKWRRISWDEAFDAIAEQMRRVKSEFGATAIAGAVSNHFVSRGVAMTQLLRSIGSPNYMINQDLCQGCRYTAAMLTGASAQPGNELARARCVLVIGESPSDSNVVQWMNIKQARRAGARIIVVDPRGTQVANMSDQWLRIKPGTDAALALSMIHVIFDEDLQDRDFVGEWCTGEERLRERAARYPPAVASGITGLPVDTIVHAARTFATTKPGCLILGHGVDAQANGVRTTIGYHALLALTGNLDREGTNRLPKQQAGFRDYFNIINDRTFRLPEEIERTIIGGERFPLWCGPDSWSKSSHNPSLIRAVLTGEPYPVKALYASGVNIVCTYPDIRDTIAALGRLDLLVVATDHITPTAELADFVLPKTTQLEEDDVSVDQSGPCLSVVQRVLPAMGEARSDIEKGFAEGADHGRGPGRGGGDRHGMVVPGDRGCRSRRAHFQYRRRHSLWSAVGSDLRLGRSAEHGLSNRARRTARDSASRGRRGRGCAMTIAGHLFLAAAAAGACLGAASSGAEAYPDRPIRMIVGFPPGGGADIMARLISAELGGKLASQVVVDNRPGAGSSTATGMAAKATADGYTILFATSSFTINPNLYANAPYDPIRDFSPVARVVSSPFVVVVRPSLPVRSIKELLALARAKPGQLNYSTGGNGSVGHLAGELLKSMTKVRIQHVPYKGLAPALADLLGGRVDFTMSSLPACIAFLNSGRLRALAVTTEKRMPFVPDIPSVSESGIEGYDVDQWYGVLAPGGTPGPVVRKLNGALAAFLAEPQPALLERFAALGASPLISTPENFRSYIRTNLAFWEKVVRQANAKVE
ncbi:MAG: molybdopterin-dependent oxidoreductase [Burkholderiales bacterium]|nr:molybdopterin-dependent oxidoreductase [Burkholderiales bacterium]